MKKILISKVIFLILTTILVLYFKRPYLWEVMVVVNIAWVIGLYVPVILFLYFVKDIRILNIIFGAVLILEQLLALFLLGTTIKFLILLALIITLPIYLLCNYLERKLSFFVLSQIVLLDIYYLLLFLAPDFLNL